MQKWFNFTLKNFDTQVGKEKLLKLQKVSCYRYNIPFRLLKQKCLSKNYWAKATNIEFMWTKVNSTQYQNSK